MNADASKDLAELETRWRVRERKWARRLGRLRLGVEPLEEQLNRYRRTTWALALVLAFVLVNSVFYSFYANTSLHPRFLYASLPELFVLCAAGVYVLVGVVARWRTSAPSEAVGR